MNRKTSKGKNVRENKKDKDEKNERKKEKQINSTNNNKSNQLNKITDEQIMKYSYGIYFLCVCANYMLAYHFV